MSSGKLSLLRLVLRGEAMSFWFMGPTRSKWSILEISFLVSFDGRKGELTHGSLIRAFRYVLVGSFDGCVGFEISFTCIHQMEGVELLDSQCLGDFFGGFVEEFVCFVLDVVNCSSDCGGNVISDSLEESRDSSFGSCAGGGTTSSCC